MTLHTMVADQREGVKVRVERGDRSDEGKTKVFTSGFSTHLLNFFVANENPEWESINRTIQQALRYYYCRLTYA